MSKMSDYLENAFLNHVLRNSALTSPTTVYLALFTADPTDANSPDNEITGLGGYARNACAFDAPSGGVSVNSAAEDFTAAGEAWGTITHWALFDAATNGNMLIHAPLTASKAVGDGDTLRFAAGDISVTAA